MATTSSGHAATLGRLDGCVDRAEALAHAAGIVAAVDVPVSADLENGFAAEPSAVFATVEAAVGVGLAGCSIEDFTGDPDAPFYDAMITPQAIDGLNKFAVTNGLLDRPLAYEQIAAAQFADIWRS